MAKKSDSLANNLISKKANLILKIILLIGCILTILPLWLIVSASLTENAALTQFGYKLWPMKFSTLAYTYLFQSGSIIVTA